MCKGLILCCLIYEQLVESPLVCTSPICRFSEARRVHCGLRSRGGGIVGNYCCGWEVLEALVWWISKLLECNKQGCKGLVRRREVKKSQCLATRAWAGAGVVGIGTGEVQVPLEIEEVQEEAEDTVEVFATEVVVEGEVAMAEAVGVAMAGVVEVVEVVEEEAMIEEDSVEVAVGTEVATGFVRMPHVEM